MKKDFFTWQSFEAWEMAEKTGFLQADDGKERYPEIYSMMKQQMEKRIEGYKKEEGVIWLRSFYIDKNFSDHSLQTFSKQILLKVTLEETRLLSSSYPIWNQMVLDYSFKGIIPTQEEMEQIFNTQDLFFLDIQYTTGKIKRENIQICEVI